MSDRITQRDLEGLCRVVNTTLNGNNDALWSREVSNVPRANIGAFYIDGAYGGVALYRIVTEGGGVSDVFRSGHMTKRDLYNRMRALLDGIELKGSACHAAGLGV